MPYIINKSSSFYEHHYVKNPEFQNLVIKNDADEIIARAVLYLNKEEQYAVIRQYDVNSEYIKDKYEEIIYDTLKRGLNCLIENYNNKNPDNPLNNLCIEMNGDSQGLSNFIKGLDESKTHFTIIPLNKVGYYPKREQYCYWQREQSIDKNDPINNYDESR